MALTGYGFVKEVLSGDTLVIIGQPRNGPPPELKLTLASLQAPRLALKPTTMSATNLTTQDQEPYAWESRQFLRKLCIGKKVFFKVEYTVQSIGRQFGAVYLLEGNESGSLFSGTGNDLSENVCLTVAREGWCYVRVREKTGDNEKSQDVEQLLSLSQAAEAEGRGVFNKELGEKSIRTVKWDFTPNKTDGEEETNSEVVTFYNRVKQAPQKAIIEYIRDGASMKALLLDSMTLITFNLAGVQCPRMNIGQGHSDPQEYAQEAKFFTEVRLLNREVKLKIGGLSEKYATFFGSILYENKNSNGKVKKYNISVELVKNGLALPADWSMSYTTPSNAASIHAAVHVAKKVKLRMWKGYVPPTIPGEKSYSGVVAEVLSGDSFVVRVGDSDDLISSPWKCEERRINLSSVRSPRANRSSRSEQDEPFAAAAKEFLRSKLIGKKCNVDVEYLVDGGGGSRKYGTVTFVQKKNKVNVACMMLEEGLATVIGHKQGAERSEFYHELIESERKGQEAKKNIWSVSQKTKTTEDSVKKVVDVNNAVLAKSYLPSLKSEHGEKRVKGIVDYVFNGDRMKVLIPSEDIIITLNLSGIQCPSTSRTQNVTENGRSVKKQVKPQEFSEEALSFTKALCLQKDVEIVVETVDRGGNFIGTMFVKDSRKHLNRANTGGYQPPSRLENLAVLLIQNGLAQISKFGIRMARHSDELIAEERSAKEAKVGLWENYVEEDVHDDMEEDRLKSPEKSQKENRKPMETIECTVCHINDANNFFVQVKKEEGKLRLIEQALEKLGNDIGTEPLESNESVMDSLTKDQNLVALFNDGSSPKWYRAKILKILKNDNEKTAMVQYIDFGNEEEVGSERLKVWADPQLFKIEALAHESSLPFVTAPDLSEEFGRDAALYLSQLTANHTLQAKVHSKDTKSGKLVLSLLPVGQTKLHASEEVEKVTDGESKELMTVGGLLLKEGLAVMSRKARGYLWGSDEENEILQQMKKDQEFAHYNHVNLWAYGDPRPDEDDQRF